MESWNGFGWEGPQNPSHSMPCCGQGQLPPSLAAPSHSLVPSNVKTIPRNPLDLWGMWNLIPPEMFSSQISFGLKNQKKSLQILPVPPHSLDRDTSKVAPNPSLIKSTLKTIPRNFLDLQRVGDLIPTEPFMEKLGSDGRGRGSVLLESIIPCFPPVFWHTTTLPLHVWRRNSFLQEKIPSHPRVQSQQPFPDRRSGSSGKEGVKKEKENKEEREPNKSRMMDNPRRRGNWALPSSPKSHPCVPGNSQPVAGGVSRY